MRRLAVLSVILFLAIGCASSERLLTSYEEWGQDLADVMTYALDVENSAKEVHRLGWCSDDELTRVLARVEEARGHVSRARSALELAVTGIGEERAVQGHVDAATFLLDSSDTMLKIWGKR